MNEIKEIKVGVKIDMDKGPFLFGADEVNDLIAKGWRVLGLQPGGIIFNKLGKEGDKVSLVISGCDMKVTMQYVEVD